MVYLMKLCFANNYLWQLANILARLARRLAILARQKPVAVSFLTEVLERLARAVGRVVVPTLLGDAVVVLTATRWTA